MSDFEFITMVVYLGLVAGAWYHGHQVGIKLGAGEMYDFLYKRGKEYKNRVIVRLEKEEKKPKNV